MWIKPKAKEKILQMACTYITKTINKKLFDQIALNTRFIFLLAEQNWKKIEKLRDLKGCKDFKDSNDANDFKIAQKIIERVPK